MALKRLRVAAAVLLCLVVDMNVSNSGIIHGLSTSGKLNVVWKRVNLQRYGETLKSPEINPRHESFGPAGLGHFRINLSHHPGILYAEIQQHLSTWLGLDLAVFSPEK